MANNLKDWHAMREGEMIKREKLQRLGVGYCTSCDTEKPIEEFYANNSNKSRLKYIQYCKLCISEKRQSDSGGKKKAKAHARQKRAYWKMRSGGECAKCGHDKTQHDLDFHHCIPEEKLHNITYLMSKNNDALTESEIDKCILLCANCHRQFEGGCWSADFVKNADVGYSIKPGSIKEHADEYWAGVPDKIIMTQVSLFSTIRLER